MCKGVHLQWHVNSVQLHVTAGVCDKCAKCPKCHCARNQCIIVSLFQLPVYLTELCTAVHCQIITKLVTMIVLTSTHTWSLEAQVEIRVHP